MKHPATPVLATALLLASLLSSRPTFAADDFNPLHLRTYTQTFTLRYASPADAEHATLTAMPVYDGKSWAFSARWDDNRLNDFPVHAAMRDAGIKGTFYLNASRSNFAADKALKLMEGGCSIGGHTQTHPLLTAITPNEAFYEVLANRVQREAETDRQINSFAFPFGRYTTRNVPQIQTDITQVLTRAGFFNTTYMDFARNNPNLLPNEFSTGYQVVPGDHQVDPAKFDQQVAHVLSMAKPGKEQSHCIHIGVHAAQTGQELEKLAAVFKKYAGNPDWWYCSMTQYAAYDRQYRFHKLELANRDGATCTYRLTRPVPAELGDDVPLTFQIENAKAEDAHAAGFACTLTHAGDRALLNLGHGPDENAPTRIDAIDNDANAAAAPTNAKLADSPQISAWLYCDVADKQLHLTLENRGSTPMTQLFVTFRLPLLYVDGLHTVAVDAIGPGQKRDVALPLGQTRDGAEYLAGRAYFVAEINCRLADEADRIFATTRLPAPDELACLRDASWMLGPIAESDIHLDALHEVASPGTAPKNLGDGPLDQWFVSSAADRARFSTDRAICWRNDKAWKQAAGKFDYKPQCYLVAIDFDLSQAAAIKLQTEAKVIGILLNGKPVENTQTIDGASAGANRLLLALSISDGRASYGPFPIYLKLTPAAGDLTYDIHPAAP